MQDRRTPAATQADDAVTCAEGTTALVLDSPHSGSNYPADFKHACSRTALREAEDTFVDALWDFAPTHGATLVCAQFPRTYIDANRALDEIDTELLNGPWEGPINHASAKVRLGKGLVWRKLDNGTPIYGERLSPDMLQARIDGCWVPYHAAVERAIEAAARRKGFVIHLNCHSMPARGGEFSSDFPGILHDDFVLGDRDGSTADPALTRWIERFLNSRGNTVSLNYPYKGVELVKRHGDPGRRRHSIQIEINKRLYMNEKTLAPNEGFAQVQQVLRELTETLLGWDGFSDISALRSS